MNLPHIRYPYDTSSRPTTPWHEQAPLFAHELVGSHEGEVESPITSESLESPIKPEPQDEVIDLNDPTLERFPEDRMSILTHIRSCESRMSEDETNVQGVPPSPITRDRSRSPSIDTPGSAGLDAQASPALDVITEENLEEDSYFEGLPGPIQKLQSLEEVRQPEELNVIHEAEEPIDDPKTVLENLKKIEGSTADSDNTTVEEELAKPEVDEIMPLEGTVVVEEHDVIGGIKEQAKDQTETMDSLSSDGVGDPTNPQPGPTSVEVQTEFNEKGVGNKENADIEEVYAPEETISDTYVHQFDPPEKVFAHVEQSQGPAEQSQDDVSHNLGQLYSHDGVLPEVPNNSQEDFNEHGVVHDGQAEVEQRHEFIQNGELHQAEDGEGQQNVVPLMQDVFVPPSSPGFLHSEAKIPENEKPDDNMNANVPGHVNVALEEHDDYLQPSEVVRVPEAIQVLPELTQMVELQERGNILPDHVGGNSMGRVSMKNLAAESKIEARGVAQVFTIQGSNADHDVLERDVRQSAVALEDAHTESNTTRENDLPVLESKADEVLLATEHDKPGSESQVENAPTELDKSAILETPEPVVETFHVEDLPVLEAKSGEVPLSEHDTLGSDSQVENASTELEKSAIAVGSSQPGLDTSHEADLPVLPVKTDEIPLTTENEALRSDSQVENGSTEPDKSAILENLEPVDETTRETELLVLQTKADEALYSAEHDALGSDVQAENASTEAVKSAITIENPQTGLDTTQGTDLPVLQTEADETLLTLDHEALGLSKSKSAIYVEQPSAEVEPIHKADLPISQIKIDEQASEIPAEQVLDSEVDKSASVEDKQPEIETVHGADLSLPQLTPDDAMLVASHVKSGTSDNYDVDEVESTLTNGVDGAKSTSVDASSQNGHDNDSKLGPPKTAPPTVERQLTPDSIRSTMKASDSENKKSIWRTVFGDWLGGLFASLCGGERGP